MKQCRWTADCLGYFFLHGIEHSVEDVKEHGRVRQMKSREVKRVYAIYQLYRGQSQNQSRCNLTPSFATLNLHIYHVPATIPETTST